MPNDLIAEFRDLTEADLEACEKIWLELKNHYDHPIGGEWAREKILAELTGHNGYGAFSPDGELMAFCLWRKITDGREIMLLATSHRTHRTGAMRSLIRTLIGDLNADEVIWLEVHAGNLPAIALYESLGFKQTGERADYYFDGGKALLYEYKPLQ